VPKSLANRRRRKFRIEKRGFSEKKGKREKGMVKMKYKKKKKKRRICLFISRPNFV